MLIVSLDLPHRILKFTIGTYEILGYTEKLLQGRTLQVFHGPTTDSVSITSAIKACLHCKTTTLHLNLYELSGECHAVLASFEPYCDGGGVPDGCKLSFESSQIFTSDAVARTSPRDQAASSPPCADHFTINASAKQGTANTSIVRAVATDQLTLEQLRKSADGLEQPKECGSLTSACPQTMPSSSDHTPRLYIQEPALLCIDKLDEGYNLDYEPMRKVIEFNGTSQPRRFYPTFWRGLVARLRNFQKMKCREDLRSGQADQSAYRA